MRLAVLLALSGCMPPSVKAVDEWLTHYAAGDVEGTVAASASADRDLVRAAMVEQGQDPHGGTALLLPPKPIKYELREIASKDSDDRHVVLAWVTAKNPLPFASERVGQVLDGIPKTRSDERKFLSVREGERWVVKLDLPAVKARADFATTFFDAMAKKDFEVAKAMLAHVPPPPDDPNALSTKDRMLEDLKRELEKRTATSSAAH